MGARFTLGQLVQESLLESERLILQEKKAEGSTPQAFEAHTQAKEANSIAAREDPDAGSDIGGMGGENIEGTEAPEGEGQESEAAEGEAEGESQEESSPEEQTTVGGDEDPEGAIEEEPSEDAESTNEGLDDWISGKTRNSDSAIVRGAGAVAAGLTGLGIKYGPGTAKAVGKGALWAFSRAGTGIIKGTGKLSSYIEKSRNSNAKLSMRLKAAEKTIIDKINSDEDTKVLPYSNKKVLAYLKVGKDLDIAGNIQVYAKSLSSVTNAIAKEFEAGNMALEKLVRTAGSNQDANYGAFMEVGLPKAMKPGGSKGEQIRSITNQLFHTEPFWPGDVSLVFQAPKVGANSSVEMITGAYQHSKMYTSVTNGTGLTPGNLSGLQMTDLIMIAKATHMLLATCDGVSKTQEKMKSMTPGMGNAIKRAFFALADDKAKADKDHSADMIYLRSKLCTDVFVDGSTASLIHASRVAASAVKLLEDYAKAFAPKQQ